MGFYRPALRVRTAPIQSFFAIAERLAMPKSGKLPQLSAQAQAELRHRGEQLDEYPSAGLWQAVGGEEGVAALIADLYRRIEQDPVLREVFPHFHSELATPFF